MNLKVKSFSYFLQSKVPHFLHAIVWLKAWLKLKRCLPKKDWDNLNHQILSNLYQSQKVAKISSFVQFWWNLVKNLNQYNHCCGFFNEKSDVLLVNILFYFILFYNLQYSILAFHKILIIIAWCKNAIWETKVFHFIENKVCAQSTHQQ